MLLLLMVTTTVAAAAAIRAACGARQWRSLCAALCQQGLPCRKAPAWRGPSLQPPAPGSGGWRHTDAPCAPAAGGRQGGGESRAARAGVGGRGRSMPAASAGQQRQAHCAGQPASLPACQPACCPAPLLHAHPCSAHCTLHTAQPPHLCGQLRLVVVHEQRVRHHHQRAAQAQRLKDAARPCRPDRSVGQACGLTAGWTPAA